MSSSKNTLLPFEQASEEAQADWRPAQESFMINWMKEQVIARGEGRVAGTFSKSEWIELRKECYKAWGMKYSSKAFKNKFTSLKERFKEFKKLVEAASGLGWNLVLSTIDASDIWWNEYGKAHPKMKYLKRFRGLGCPEYKDLEVIFGDTIATGHLQTTENHDFDSTDRDDSPNDVTAESHAPPNFDFDMRHTLEDEMFKKYENDELIVKGEGGNNMANQASTSGHRGMDVVRDGICRGMSTYYRLPM
ncbi:hypothetical protein FRX31_008551 [Thalictrum thalictroides]|uniref:Myb/SANT-like domain-containing protein n=1 Tax=Thalictrum thalictroides TaxID=46969 RepID=A0A7J6WXS1_THATH|nr:hypothetical protein FRX31_008551 [Thalictrum thalictroides]